MFVLIDNYDSFTYNLYHLLAPLADVCVVRNDATSVDEVLAHGPAGLIISPGPGAPEAAGISVELVQRLSGRLPILGVCLGHQAIGAAFGGEIVRAGEPVHGKIWQVAHRGDGVFRGLPDPFPATRYHSLVIERKSLPEALVVTAETADGLIMGVRHAAHPTFGVQFHPESIATDGGAIMIENFLAVAEEFGKAGAALPAEARA